MGDNLKRKTISGLFWNSLQRFGTLFITFFTNLLFARFLSPEDFGCIGLMMVFVAIANTLIDGGFATALIHKSSPTHDDYSTIFLWNLFVSAALYILLFLCSPQIAEYYHIPQIEKMLQILGLLLLTNAFQVVQINILIKKLNFKFLALITLSANIIGAFIGITMLFKGHGVWSMIIQLLIASLLINLFLWAMSDWKPSLVFKWDSFKSLFKFGGFICISSLIETVHENIQSLIIGKVFTHSQLGYYTNARKMSDVPVAGLSQIINQVAFPVYVKLREESNHLLFQAVQRSLKFVAYLTFPFMTFLIINAQNIFRILFTNKWDNSVPYFQILCLAGMLTSFNSINMTVIKTLGKGNVFFTIQLTKRTIGIIMIILGMTVGIYGIMWAIVFNSLIFFLINAIVLDKYIKYGFFKQVKDILPSFLSAILVGLIVYSCNFILIDSNIIIQLSVSFLFYVILYIISSFLVNKENNLFLYEFLHRWVEKK